MIRSKLVDSVIIEEPSMGSSKLVERKKTTVKALQFSRFQSENLNWVNCVGNNEKGGFIYNPDMCPADISLSKKHDKATSLGYKPVTDKFDKPSKVEDFCPCCGLDATIEPLP